MSTIDLPRQAAATVRREPDQVMEVGGVYVAVQHVHEPTAEILADPSAVEKIYRRRERGPVDIIWDDELDPSTVEWAEDDEFED